MSKQMSEGRKRRRDYLKHIKKMAKNMPGGNAEIENARKMLKEVSAEEHQNHLKLTAEYKALDYSAIKTMREEQAAAEAKAIAEEKKQKTDGQIKHI